eukprot:scaffold108805_cov73-Phaeocystis_antarctica.AAC.1
MATSAPSMSSFTNPSAVMPSVRREYDVVGTVSLRIRCVSPRADRMRTASRDGTPRLLMPLIVDGSLYATTSSGATNGVDGADACRDAVFEEPPLVRTNGLNADAWCLACWAQSIEIARADLEEVQVGQCSRDGHRPGSLVPGEGSTGHDERRAASGDSRGRSGRASDFSERHASARGASCPETCTTEPICWHEGNYLANRTEAGVLLSTCTRRSGVISHRARHLSITEHMRPSCV